MCNPATARSFLCLAQFVGLALAGTTLWAQTGTWQTPQHFSSRANAMMPVNAMHSVPKQAASTQTTPVPQSQPSDWKLQWRQSSATVASKTTDSVGSDPFAQPMPAQRQHAMQSVATLQFQKPAEPSTAETVKQTAWLQDSDPGDFFSNPFGDRSVPTPARTNVVPPAQPAINMPSNGLRGSARTEPAAIAPTPRSKNPPAAAEAVDLQLPPGDVTNSVSTLPPRPIQTPQADTKPLPASKPRGPMTQLAQPISIAPRPKPVVLENQVFDPVPTSEQTLSAQFELPSPNQPLDQNAASEPQALPQSGNVPTPNTLPAPQATKPQESALPVPMDNVAPEPSPEPSLREMLEQESMKQAEQSEASDDESPSDLNEFDNPFNRDLDDEDLRRLQERSRRESANRGGFEGNGDSDDSLSDAQRNDDFSCEDFRQRIAQQTIRDLSLDISAPYRPDILNEKEFFKEKSKFDSEQISRDWTSPAGQVLGRGRLTDLAYEKAVVVGDDGNTQRIPIDRLGQEDLEYISENWGLPRECLLAQTAYQPRQWKPLTMTWKASNLCHQPLYFEDVNLERYGHTHGPLLEPIVSSAHFFANIAILPYRMGVHAPNECQYALGYYRPGSCAPWIKDPFPISARGALAQGAWATGLFWLVP